MQFSKVEKTLGCRLVVPPPLSILNKFFFPACLLPSFPRIGAAAAGIYWMSAMSSFLRSNGPSDVVGCRRFDSLTTIRASRRARIRRRRKREKGAGTDGRERVKDYFATKTRISRANKRASSPFTRAAAAAAAESQLTTRQEGIR